MGRTKVYPTQSAVDFIIEIFSTVAIADELQYNDNENHIKSNHEYYLFHALTCKVL